MNPQDSGLKETRREFRWLQAMNAAAEFLQRAAVSEEQIFQIFQKQISLMGLRGGLALLDQDKARFIFRSIAQPGRMNVLQRLERMFNLRADGFSIAVSQVDVYAEVFASGEPVFVEDTSQVFAQMLSFSEKGLLARVLEVFGRDPAVYLPLHSQEQIVGVLNVAGSDLSIEDIPALKAFASYISAALANAQLFNELKDQEFAYRSLFNNLPLGIYRVSQSGKIMMANPVFLEQFRVDSFEQIEGKTLREFGLIPLHDRDEVLRRLAEQMEIIGLESEWETSTGEKVFFKENVKASLGLDGAVLYYEGSVEDITERKKTERILKKQLDDLMVLNRVAATGAGASNLDDLLESVTEIIGEQLFPDHFGMILWDPAKQTLKLHPSYRGVPDESMSAEFLPGQGIVGTVFNTGEPLLVADTSQHPDYISSGRIMASELCVPIKTGDQVIGVLNAEMEATNGFTVEDEILLLTLSDQLATALDRVTFFDAVENQALQLALLNEAVLTTSRILDPNELFRLIATQIKELFKPDSFVVTLFDEGYQQLEIAIAYSGGEIDSETTGMLLSLEQGGLTTLVIETGQVLHVDDLENSPLIVGMQKSQSKMVGSWVGVPLISGKKVIGALAVQYYDKMLIDKDQTQFLVSMASHAAIAITNGRMFDDVQRRFELSNRLAAISETLNRSQTVEDVIVTIGKSSCQLMNNSAGIVCLISEHGGLDCVWHAGLDETSGKDLNQAFSRTILSTSLPVILPDTTRLPPDHDLYPLVANLEIGAVSLWPMVYEGQTIAVVGCFKTQPYQWRDEEQDVMMTFARQAAVSLQNARLLESERSRRMEAEALYKTTTALTSALDLDQVLDNILVELYRVVDYASASIQLIEQDTIRIVAVQGLLLDSQKMVGWQYPSSNGLIMAMRETHQPIVLENAMADDRFVIREPAKYIRGWIGVPLIVGERMIGCLTIDSDTVGAFNHTHAEKAKAFANQAAIAIETARLFGQTQKRLQVLQSIHTIDQAISRSMDLPVILDVFMEQALSLLNVEAVRVFSYDGDAQMFEIVADRNALSPNLLKKDTFYDPEMVRKVIRSRTAMFSNHLSAVSSLTSKGFSCYSAAPLTTRGEIRGVLEVFHSQKFTPNEEWLDLLSTLATQAAIAIENSDLLTSLKRSNEELISAYDRTLEGWAYALELRDRETVGHSRRVTTMMVQLARNIGISGPELANIRRGTLLHDIGKMGLPDSILLKKGPLTSEEEKVMHTHPQLAYDMLVTIPYLKQALEIPYYHHEKWDGSGYPHGLKGEGIPLSARIFAVVDVWDALVFDRPYREAWTKQEAIDYIKAQTGTHFDPQVVEQFLEIVDLEDTTS